jgi:hypothetical protein
LVKFAGHTRDQSGTLHGKVAVRDYWSAALEQIPDLHFELISVLVGVRSITVCYKGARDRLASGGEGNERICSLCPFRCGMRLPLNVSHRLIPWHRKIAP